MNQFISQLKTFWSHTMGGAHVSHTPGKKIGLRPEEDWLFILGFLAIGFIVSAGIALYIYMNVTTGTFVKILPAQSSSQAPSLNAGQLQEVENYFAAKQSAAATSTPADPSK